MRRFSGSFFLLIFILPAELHADDRLDFREFMSSFNHQDIGLQAAQESERIWQDAQLEPSLGWDRQLTLDWSRQDFNVGKDQTDASARVTQFTPYGVSGAFQIQHHDPLTGVETGSAGIDVDLLRNRFGQETDQQRELLALRKTILGLATLEAGFQACINSLNSVSRYMLLEHETAIYADMLKVRQRLHDFVKRRLNQGALGRTDLLSVEAEITSLEREAQTNRQAMAEWMAREQTRLSRRFTGLDLSAAKSFQEFAFIPQQKSAWLPELSRLDKQLEESKEQQALIEEQSRSRLQVFGRTHVDVQGQDSSRQEYGLSLTLPLQDFSSKRQLSQQKLATQDLQTQKRLTEQKAALLMAETDARITAINQRLNEGELVHENYLALDRLLWDQYQKGAVDLERLFRQQELRLREELIQEQTRYELRAARSLYVLMQRDRPHFCLGVANHVH